MERVGLFSEMEYVTIGDKYKNPMPISLRKGKGFNVPTSKVKSSNYDGYFEDTYSRILDGEAYTDHFKLRRQFELKQLKKNLSKNFYPSNGFKESCGAGSFYGTFGGIIPSMCNVEISKGLYKPQGKNVLTNPGKKGTGYGYLDVTLGEYYKHLSDPYERARQQTQKEQTENKQKMKGSAFKLNMHPEPYFDPNPYFTNKMEPEKKKILKKREVKPFYPSHVGLKDGGMKAGTFEAYPSHSNDEYVRTKSSHAITVMNKSGKIFVPPRRGKSRPISSIMHLNVMRSVNNQNYKTM